jgi:hypothetical protein
MRGTNLTKFVPLIALMGVQGKLTEIFVNVIFKMILHLFQINAKFTIAL